MTVRFLDLTRQTAAMRPEIDAAIAGVLDSGRYIFGEEVERFEEEFARYCGCRYAVGVASGTDAITIALLAAGVGEGDEVITAPNTCVPTIVGIERAGAVAVLADVDPTARTLDPDCVEQAISERTAAILPVHLYGFCADLDRLGELAARHGLKLIEDCAQAHGARIGGRPAGSVGLAGAFSFYPTKNLGGVGDGGMVTTNDPEVYERARLLRNYGERERFEHVARGLNSRLDPVQAAVLRVKLRYLEQGNARRVQLARLYDDALRTTPLTLPSFGEEGRHVFHLYVVESPRRDAIRSALNQRGIETAIQYPAPVHAQPAYRDLIPLNRSLSVSESLASRILSLPLYAELRDVEAERVAQAVRDATASGS